MAARRARTALAGTAPRSPSGAVRGLVLAAVPLVVWFAHLNVNYFLVPPSCGWGHRWAFLLSTLVAVGIIALTGLASWRAWRTDRRPDTGDLVAFLGLAGVAIAVLFALTTIVVGASALVVHPCT